MRRRKIVGSDASETTATDPAAFTDEASASGEREKPEPDPVATAPAPSREQEITKLQNEAVQRTRARATTPSAEANPEDVGETVSATWGEELYTPQQFFTFRVGPFSRQTKIRAGETAPMAKARVEAELEQMAKAERTKKMSIFLDTMEELFAAVKQRQAVKS